MHNHWLQRWWRRAEPGTPERKQEAADSCFLCRDWWMDGRGALPCCPSPRTPGTHKPVHARSQCACKCMHWTAAPANGRRRCVHGMVAVGAGAPKQAGTQRSQPVIVESSSQAIDEARALDGEHLASLPSSKLPAILPTTRAAMRARPVLYRSEMRNKVRDQGAAPRYEGSRLYLGKLGTCTSTSSLPCAARAAPPHARSLAQERYCCPLPRGKFVRWC